MAHDRDGAGEAIVMIEGTSTICQWCERAFRARQTGGRAQRFCRSSCRRAFHAAVRSWALDSIGDGTLTLAEIRNDGPCNARVAQKRGPALAATGGHLVARQRPPLPAGTVYRRSAVTRRAIPVSTARR